MRRGSVQIYDAAFSQLFTETCNAFSQLDQNYLPPCPEVSARTTSVTMPMTKYIYIAQFRRTSNTSSMPQYVVQIVLPSGFFSAFSIFLLFVCVTCVISVIFWSCVFHLFDLISFVIFESCIFRWSTKGRKRRKLSDLFLLHRICICGRKTRHNRKL